MKILTEVEKDEVLSYISREVQKSQTTVLCVTADDSPDERPWKRIRLSSVDEFGDEPGANKATEIQRYKELAAQGCSDILQWWQEHRLEFPALSDLVKNTLCVMATSTVSERVFRMAGHVVNSRRANLKSSSVNDILFFNSALKAKEEAPNVG